MNNDPAAPQVPPAAGSNDSDKELTDAALAAASVNPLPAVDTQAPVEQPAPEVEQATTPVYPDVNQAAPAPEVTPTTPEAAPANDQAIEPATPLPSNPIPVIPVNDSTVPPAEPTQAEVPQASAPTEPVNTQPTPGAFGTDTANQTQQNPSQPEGFMAKFLSIFKK